MRPFLNRQARLAGLQPLPVAGEQVSDPLATSESDEPPNEIGRRQTSGSSDPLVSDGTQTLPQELPADQGRFNPMELLNLTNSRIKTTDS